MASTDSSSISRFKAFKFTANSSKPPPLPPKDPIYLQRQTNRSQASLLSPDAASPPPASPLSPSVQYAIRRTNSPSPSPLNSHMNHSSSSLSSPHNVTQYNDPAVSSTPSSSGSASNKQAHMSLASRKALSFLKFPKRSPRTPPATRSEDEVMDPSPGHEDDAISLPWNFQHNIHVDEGYVGIPPSWSTSLQTAGFTDEEIIEIQARRGQGARSPPDLRYLYTDRPNSPAVAINFALPANGQGQPQPYSASNYVSPSVYSAQQQQQTVPILTNPTPRSTSLPRLVSLGDPSMTGVPPVPPVPSIHSSSSNASLQGSVSRVPAPKRKPPASPFEEDERGHKPNQPSNSTLNYSSDSHARSNSSHHATASSSLHPHPINESTSNLSNRSHQGEPSMQRLSEASYATVRPANVGASDYGIAEVSREEAGSGNLNAEAKEKKGSVWGSKLAKATASTPNLSSLFSSQNNGLSSSSTKQHSKDNSISLSSSSHSHDHPSSGSSNSHGNSKEGPILSPSAPWNIKAGASSLAAAGSSFAAASSTFAGGVVSKMKSSAGRGVLKVRNASLKRDKSKETSESAEARTKSPMSDDGFLPMDTASEIHKPGSVWELYTGKSEVVGIGKSSGQALENGSRDEDDRDDRPGPSNGITNHLNSSTHSLDSDSHAETSSLRGKNKTRLNTKTAETLRKQLSNNKANGSQTSLRSGKSIRSQKSQGSLRLRQHKHSGSVTSLDSIPEASPAPGAVLYISETRKGPAAASANSHANTAASSSGHGELHNGSTDSLASLSKVTSKITSAMTTPTASPEKPKASRFTNAPPRLSLHQADQSSDLASWSEALLSGISLTGSEDGFGLGKEKNSEDFEGDTLLGLDFTKFVLSNMPSSAPPSADNAFGAQQQQIPQSSQPHTQAQTPASSLSRPVLGTQVATNINGATTAVKAQSTGTVPTLGSLSSQPQIQPVNSQSSTTTTTTTVSHGSHRRKPGQPLPSSKPPPRLPAPAPPIQQNGNGVTPSGSASSSTTSLSGNQTAKAPGTRGVPTPLALGHKPKAPSTSITAPLPQPPARSNTLPPQAEGMLSPPPSAWNGVKSPPGTGVTSPGASSAGPDSAQLWNEIEQMMDPAMLSSVPGLHLSVALPPGAKDVLKSAGLTGEFRPTPPGPLPPLGAVKEDSTKREEKTVGDLVGQSPDAEVSVAARRTLMDLDGDDDESVYEPEEDDDYEGGLAYEAIIDDDDDLVDDEPAVVEPLKIGRLATRDDDQSLTIPERVPRPRPADDLSVEERETNRDSTRSSTSTLNAQTMATAAIVRNVSVARRAGAYVIDNRSPSVSSFVDSKSPVHTASSSISGMRTNTPPLSLGRPPPSSLGTAENGGGSPGSVSSGSPSLENPTPTTTDDGIASPLLYYLDGTQTPSPTPDKMSFDQVRPPPSRRLPPMKEEEYDEDAEFDDGQQLATYPTEAAVQAYLNAAGSPTPSRPTIVISDVPTPSADRGQQTAGTASSNATPLSPFQRYRGWLSAVVAPLEEFIDEAVDPRDHYLDLSEIAEGESGSVFAARLNHENATKLRLPPLIKAQDNDEIMQGRDRLVAIKSVAIVPSGSPKLQDLQRELSLMRGLWHENVLGMDGVYVDLVEDSLWVRMELMERSLADVIGLVGEGLTLPDRIIARFASDVLLALEYLSKHNITHRDVRSDNLLINKHGVLKLADFSNAVQVTREAPMRSEIVGVAFWQAPEVRRPPYNALKIDVWSLGATVWEMAQTEPPFADTQQLAERWPPLRQPELYSPAFHDFLRKCSEPAASRPSAAELLKTPFVNNACGRPVMVQLLSQCMAIEKLLQEGGA